VNRVRKIELKGKRGLDCMRSAGRVVGEILGKIQEEIRAGISTKYLDNLAHRLMVEKGAVPAFLGYRGYPACICTSINEEVVHGIPKEAVKLKEGDILSVDIGVVLNGYVGDMAATFGVGNISEEKKKLLEVTDNALFEGIARMQPGNRLGDLSNAIQTYVESRGYGVVRDFVGHGIGRNLHEEPQVPNFGPKNTGVTLEEGLVLAVEPMVTQGGWQVKVLNDGWTVVTKDRKPSAHFEHMIAVTGHGPEILTDVFKWKNP